MSGSADDDSDDENIIIPDFHDYKLELLYEDEDLTQDDDLSQDDDEESQDFYTILEPGKSEDQELFLQVLENLKNAVCADDLKEADTGGFPRSDRSEVESDLPDLVSNKQITAASSKHLSYACRLCSFVTETELKIKEHLKIHHNKRKKRKFKKFYPHIAIDENGVSCIKLSDAVKSHILRKLITPNIQVKGSKVYVERLKFCHPCLNDMSHKEASIRPKDSGLPTKVANDNDVSSSDSVNVPVVMVGKQGDSDKPDTITLVSSEKQMCLKPVAATSSAISIFKCNSCDYYSNNKNYLKQHMDIVHNSLRPYKCPFCDYAGKRSHALREHLIVHSSERPFECNFCNATFRKKGHLTNHIKLHNNAKTLVKCPLCKDLVCESKAAIGLTGHLQSAHGTDKLYGCDLCEFIAANEPDIVELLRNKHLKVNVYKCDRCSFDTTDKEAFENHVKKHNLTTPASSPSNRSEANSAIKPVWIKCTECGFTGQDSEVIRQHMMEHLKTDSQGSREGIQSVSSKVQSSLSNLDILSPGQLIQQVIKCSDCDFWSSDKDTFAKHAETHRLSSSVTNIQKVNNSVPMTGSEAVKTVIMSPTKPGIRTEPVLVPINELIQNTIVKQIPLASIQSSPSKESPQFIQVSGPKSKEGIRYLPATGHISQPVTSSTTDKPIVSKTRFTPSNFANTIPLTVIGNTFVRAVPQKLVSNANITTGIGQPPVATQLKNLVEITVASDQPDIDKASEKNPVSQSISQLPQNTQNVTLKEIPVPRQISVSDIPKLPPAITHLNINEDATKNESKKVSLEPEQGCENKLDTLRKSLANVQELIHQQEKLQRQQGAKQTQALDSRGIPQATDKKNVVYYITPVSKQDTLKTAIPGIAHDSSAGRFRCTICGYTCEYQRTIKAHIWKHSGNKNVEYPMFQNGPLSIYEGDQISKVDLGTVDSEVESATKELFKEDIRPVIHVAREPVTQVQTVQQSTVPKEETIDQNVNKSDTSSSALPSFIVYEESKISNVAPALAHLIAARTMVGLGDRNKNTKSPKSDSDTTQARDSVENEDISHSGLPVKRNIDKEQVTDIVPAKKSRVQVNNEVMKPINVVVENVHSVSGNTEFTGMQSQQGSPRTINSRSPNHSDSGLSELTSNSKLADDHSTSTGLFSPFSDNRLVIDDAGEDEALSNSRSKRRKFQESTETQRFSDLDLDSDRTSRQTEESAVTLLSLLRKGPNFNPACPPKAGTCYQQSSDRNSQVSSPSLDETNSTGDSDLSCMKPKSGISSSLLAVIEQLRERSKSDVEDEKPVAAVQTKKAARRRSRRGSVEDNDSAVDIDNVEQFMCEGEMKYRCKLCHYNNESTVLLRQHMRLHKTKQPFECSLCDFIADSSEGLQDHMIQHCKVRLYQCKMCPSTFNYKSQLRAHMRAHNDLDILMCDFCDFETRNVSSLRLHMKTHDNVSTFTCEICKVVFSSSQNLQAHKKKEKCQPVSENDKAAASLKCEQCEFVADHEKELKYHKRGHKLVEQTLKKCSYCEYTAASVGQVQNHIGNVHGVNKPMKCDLCGFLALSIRSLKSHMKRHVNDQRFVQQPLEQYKCNLCGYVCHHLPSLKSHMWRHAADEHYSYEFTNEIINSAIDFDGHTDAQDTTEGDVNLFRKLIHDKLKAKGIPTTKETTEKNAHSYCWVTFRCCQCGFETINKAELNVHMKAHSDVIRWTLEVSQEGEDESSDKGTESVTTHVANL